MKDIIQCWYVAIMCVWKEEWKESEASKIKKQSGEKKTKGAREFMHIWTLP